jgi:hypothetical protein
MQHSSPNRCAAAEPMQELSCGTGCCATAWPRPHQLATVSAGDCGDVLKSAAAHLDVAQVVQVGAVVGSPKGHEVGVGRAELYAAHVRLGVNRCRRILQCQQQQHAEPVDTDKQACNNMWQRRPAGVQCCYIPRRVDEALEPSGGPAYLEAQTWAPLLKRSAPDR